jgi:putative transposase
MVKKLLIFNVMVYCTHITGNAKTYQVNYNTRVQARQSIFNYIEIFYNRRLRKHSFLGNKSPKQFLKLNKAA